MVQPRFLELIKSQLSPKTSLIDEVAMVLDISYDAAHRRVTNKSKLSLEEGIKLAKYCGLSLDQLFSNPIEHNVVVKKTAPVKSIDTLLAYYQNSFSSLLPFINNPDVKMIYSAKDLPIFYTSDDNLLSKFKMYVWLKIMDTNLSEVKFSNFNPSLSLIEAAKKLGQLYLDINAIEIWDLTTINSTLKQIHFYFEADILTQNDALEICNDLYELMGSISKKITLQKSNFRFYYNELLLMNNRVLVITPTSKSLYIPFTILSYYRTNDVETCNQAEEFLNIQMNGSKLLSNVGEKERNIFFNKMLKKIDNLKSLINTPNAFDFE